MNPEGMKQSYTLTCDNCMGAFESIKPFPEPHLCSRCMVVYKSGVKEGIRRTCEVRGIQKEMKRLDMIPDYDLDRFVEYLEEMEQR